MAINPDLKLLRKKIDALLAECRPDRYTVRDSIADEALIQDDDSDSDEESDQTTWLDVIAERVEDLIPEAELRRRYARREVGLREGRSTRRANDFLREIARSGQLPLGWLDLKDFPVAIVTRDVRPGERPRIREERVALRAMTPLDFKTFANEERRRAAVDFASRNASCEGAEWIAERMTMDRASRFDAWARGQTLSD